MSAPQPQLKIRIANTTGHGVATEITDLETGQQIIARFPIDIHIDKDGVVATLRLPVSELVVDTPKLLLDMLPLALKLKPADDAKYPRETLDKLFAAGEITEGQRERLMIQVDKG